MMAPAIFSRLRARLLALFILLGIVPLALGQLLIFQTASRTILDQSRQQLSSLADKTVQQIGDFFHERDKDVRLLASHPVVQLAFLQWEFGQRLREVHDRLAAYQRENPVYQEIVLVDLRGRVLLALGGSGPHFMADAEWFRRTVRDGAVSTLFASGTDGVPTLVLARRVHDFEAPDRPVGVLAFFVSFSAVRSLVTELARPQPGEAFLVDRATGRVLAHSHPSRHSAVSPLLDRQGAGELLQKMAEADSGWGTYGGGAEQRVVAFSRYADKGWTVGVTRVTAALMTDVYRVRWIATVLVVALTLAVGVVAWVFAGRITDPILKLREGTRVFAEGDLGRSIAVSGPQEIRDLADEFNRMAARLHETVRRMIRVDRLAALGELASGVAHEVRNPLAGMKTSAQVLAGRVRDPETRSLVDGIIEEIERLDRITVDLLHFARPARPHLEAHDVALLVGKALTLVQAHLHRSDVRVIKDYAPTPPVRVDANHLQQVFLNFFLNSLKAMPEGGTLTIRCRPEDGAGVRVTIEDTGVGIAPEHVDRVFDPFFSTDAKGTGLGLSVVHTLVRENGGTVTLASEPGRGTTVTLRLPTVVDGAAVPVTETGA